jgi:hypothetical protein
MGTISEAKNTFCFRAKFRTATQFNCHVPFSVILRTFERPLIIVESKQTFGSNILDIRSCSYTTEEEAKISGERLRQLVLLAGASHGFGADFGTAGLGISWSKEVLDKYKLSTGRSLRLDRFGIDIYEEIATDFAGGEAHGSVSAHASELTNQIQGFVDLKSLLTEGQKIAAELINDTFFQPSPDAVFILSVSAIEALCPANARTSFFRKVVSIILLFVRTAYGFVKLLKIQSKYNDFDELISVLTREQQRSSVRQGYLVKMRKLLGREMAKEFDALYGERSKFVHEGLGRGAFLIKAYRARELAQKLLIADAISIA